MTQDTRKDRRVKIVSLNVRYKSATVDEFIENHAHDVSRGGIYIKTANPFPPGTLLKFEIRLASDQAVIAGVGRVVWKRDAGTSNGERPAGMGVKFIKIDEPSKSVIDRLVNTKADAGSAYESENEAPTVAVEVPHKVVVPAVTAKLSPPSGTPMAAPPRKATMMGLGTVGSAPPPAAAGSTPTPSAAATSTSSHPPSPAPRPASASAGAGAGMFPSTQGIEDMPPKQEQTVMKQAAELLEEALREAGGSMDEIGHNPLFSGTPAPIEVKSASAPPPPVASERETVPHKTGESRPPAVEAKRSTSTAPVEVKTPGIDAKAREADDAAKARAMVAGMSPAKRPPSVPPATTRESPSAKGGPVAQAAPQKKGGGGGAFILLFVLVAGAAGAAVLYRDKLFGTGDTTPTTSATQSAAPTTATASATATAAESATAPSASSAATASAAPSASVAATGSASAATSASAAPMGRPVPTTTAAPTVAPTAAATQTAAPTATAPRPTATAAPTATAPPTATATATEAPKPKPKPKPADDNPY
jgi:uncharacterized protein (TIGR02266 family)